MQGFNWLAWAVVGLQVRGPDMPHTLFVGHGSAPCCCILGVRVRHSAPRPMHRRVIFAWFLVHCNPACPAILQPHNLLPPVATTCQGTISAYLFF